MAFLNHFKDVKKMDKDVYRDVETAWAEYEYICSMIKTKILEFINNDFVSLSEEHNISEEGYVDVEVKNATVVITVKPGILISTINKIEEFLGIDGRVMISGTKKNAKIRIVFYDVTTEDLSDID